MATNFLKKYLDKDLIKMLPCYVPITTFLIQFLSLVAGPYC
jgi:hypothetical protein